MWIFASDTPFEIMKKGVEVHYDSYCLSAGNLSKMLNLAISHTDEDDYFANKPFTYNNRPSV